MPDLLVTQPFGAVMLIPDPQEYERGYREGAAASLREVAISLIEAANECLV